MDKDKLWEALQTAASGVTRIGDRRINGNREIAIIGDLALELVLAEEWHERGETRGKGIQTFITEIKLY